MLAQPETFFGRSPRRHCRLRLLDRGLHTFLGEDQPNDNDFQRLAFAIGFLDAESDTTHVPVANLVIGEPVAIDFLNRERFDQAFVAHSTYPALSAPHAAAARRPCDKGKSKVCHLSPRNYPYPSLYVERYVPSEEQPSVDSDQGCSIPLKSGIRSAVHSSTLLSACYREDESWTTNSGDCFTVTTGDRTGEFAA